MNQVRVGYRFWYEEEQKKLVNEIERLRKLSDGEAESYREHLLRKVDKRFLDKTVRNHLFET